MAAPDTATLLGSQVTFAVRRVYGLLPAGDGDFRSRNGDRAVRLHLQQAAPGDELEFPWRAA